jgi:hypothetical protein
MLARLLALIGLAPLSELRIAQASASDTRVALIQTERRLWHLIEQRLLVSKELRSPFPTETSDPARRTPGLGNIALTETPSGPRVAMDS